ncbi:MAG: REP-associated tyrosine transposase [Gammaproteobacteria bacterium]
MARPLRLEFPGALYHLSSRGNAREPIVLDDDDRRVFLSVMASVIKRFNWLCHAYCLMSNHYHLLVETPEANLSQGMRQLNGVYTQRFNRRRARVGHLFQGRFKAILVDRDSYLLELCRYVVLNPVRAKMVKDPLNYPWSSLRATAGLDPKPPCLTVDWVLGQFAKTASVARRRYTEFIRSGLGLSSPWEHLRGQVLLGGPGFVESLKPYLAGRRRLKDIPRAQRLLDRPSLETLFRKDESPRKSQRNQRIRQAHLQYAYTLSAIARYQGLHYTTVSKIVNDTNN